MWGRDKNLKVSMLLSLDIEKTKFAKSTFLLGHPLVYGGLAYRIRLKPDVLCAGHVMCLHLHSQQPQHLPSPALTIHLSRSVLTTSAMGATST
jgi:hypothetical protein